MQIDMMKNSTPVLWYIRETNTWKSVIGIRTCSHIYNMWHFIYMDSEPTNNNAVPVPDRLIATLGWGDPRGGVQYSSAVRYRCCCCSLRSMFTGEGEGLLGAAANGTARQETSYATSQRLFVASDTSWWCMWWNKLPINDVLLLFVVLSSFDN